MPQDGVLQIAQSINTYWTLHNNPTLNRFIQFFNIHNPLYPRPLIVSSIQTIIILIIINKVLTLRLDSI